MKKIKDKIWPMTSNQSFVAASLFVVVLFFLLFFTAIGEQLLCWINKNSGLATWVQAVGALAIVWATYQLHYETKKKLDIEVEERRNIEIAKAKFFLVKNSENFIKIDVFSNHIDCQIRSCSQDFVAFKSVEFFRNIFRYIDDLKEVNKNFTGLLSENLVPDICIENIYQIVILTKNVTSQLEHMLGQTNVYNTLAMIGNISKINNDPIEKNNAEYLEEYLKPWVKHITNLENELSNEKKLLEKLVFERDEK